VHDKQVRRRRAVLGLLVGASLILLTAYFGESPSSPLHAVQRGIVEVFSPIQAGASKVLSPVRDIAGWFSDTIHAKSQVANLRRENEKLTQEVDQYQYALAQNNQLRRLVGLDASAGISAYSPVAATVIERDPTLWYQTIEVDRGTADGVRVNDPVIGDKGLVGIVSLVGPNFSVVTELTDSKFAVSAMVEDGAGDTGVLVPAVGQPNQLVLQYLPAHANIVDGQEVVTAGFRSGKLTSLYPPGIPIGRVSNASQDTLLNSQQVQVDPVVDLLHLSVVQILTKPSATTQRASLP
jgi:rod shape-determining protein MreC